MRADNSSAQAAFAEAANYLERRPLVANDRPLSWITDHVCRIVEQPAPKWWWILTIITGAVATLVPAVVGVPLISPLVAMPNPPGRLVPLKVIGSVPVAVMVALNATPTVPAKVFVGERERVGATPDGPISNASASA